MKLCISAGHAATGRGASGAVGILNESNENRKVVEQLIKLLRREGCVVHDCTQNTGTQSEVLTKCVAKHNSHDRDLDIQIHFNSFDGLAHGTEALVYSDKSNSTNFARRIVKRIAALGFLNRGVKERPDLKFLRATAKPAILIECCFCDSKKDAKRYSAKKMAAAIASGLLNKEIK